MTRGDIVDSAHDKVKPSSGTSSGIAITAESSKQVVLKGMNRRFKVLMPSDSLSDTDFIIWCSPEHSTHPALDKLALVIIGRIDEDGTAMERISQTAWRYRDSIEL